MKMQILLFTFLIVSSSYSTYCADKAGPYGRYEQKIDSLLAIMTLDEKLGQLNVIADGTNLTGPDGGTIDYTRAIKEGKVSGVQNIRGVKKLKALQELAVQSRLHIPLIFPADIIHGCEVVFPIPLAQACSWDLEAIRKASAIAAREATSQGISMNYAPMADISRDPRWGRVMEGAGEDPYLAAKIVQAEVRGYQGKDLADTNTMVACVKHFAAYGAAEGGRDYNIVDMSDRRLREVYLPTYHAAIDAGVGSVMVSFNEINGMPASCNKYLLQKILRQEWGFQGFVIGDYTSVGELIPHGVAKDMQEAAELALNAGVDVDLISQAFQKHGQELITQKRVSTQTVDNAVRHILRLKYALGLMHDPFRYLNEEREKRDVYKPEYRKYAREIAQKSIVVLKNNNNLLPLKKEIKKLALIGPFIDNTIDPKGEWAFGGSHYEDIVSMLPAIKKGVSTSTEILYAKGCSSNDSATSGFAEALTAARSADLIVVGLGEPIEMIGEGNSRAQLDLPGAQLELVKELQKTGKPIVAVILAGRPLLLKWLDDNIPSIVYAWHLGHESGTAIADVLFGDYNPSAKLVLSFPYSVGQIPVYYNSKTTGRPYQENSRWCSRYIDSPNKPLYPFGYGLSYTTFEYSPIHLNKKELIANDSIVASVKVKNSGAYAGEEIVQMYLQDLKGSVTRPVKELKGFDKIFLAKGAEREVRFTIHTEDLKFYNAEMEFVAEPGEFKVFIGTSSDKTVEEGFVLSRL
jgi:beta-glucosidase